MHGTGPAPRPRDRVDEFQQHPGRGRQLDAFPRRRAHVALRPLMMVLPRDGVFGHDGNASTVSVFNIAVSAAAVVHQHRFGHLVQTLPDERLKRFKIERFRRRVAAHPLEVHLAPPPPHVARPVEVAAVAGRFRGGGGYRERVPREETRRLTLAQRSSLVLVRALEAQRYLRVERAAAQHAREARQAVRGHRGAARETLVRAREPVHGDSLQHSVRDVVRAEAQVVERANQRAAGDLSRERGRGGRRRGGAAHGCDRVGRVHVFPCGEG
eukprot:8427-Pelagococcus_subviridis.AAC.8